MTNVCEERQCTWQSAFVEILPEIQKRLRRAFRHLYGDAREDSVEEALIHCMLTFARLFENGRADTATASTLSWYAALAVRRGRPAAGRMNGKEPLSRYAQLGKGIQVERLHVYNARRDQWIDVMIDDRSASVVDQVATKMDFGAWFAMLTRRMKRIAKDLAYGFSTTEVAEKYNVTPSRISQLRRMLEASWKRFQSEEE